MYRLVNLASLAALVSCLTLLLLAPGPQCLPLLPLCLGPGLSIIANGPEGRCNEACLLGCLFVALGCARGYVALTVVGSL